MSTTSTGGSSRWTEADRERERALLAELAALQPDDPEYRSVRDRLVVMNMPLVEYLARRFSDRGEAHEDLVQVGMVGLIKAVDRFDVGRGVELSTYATPTIVGEIKRHFRDKGWAVRVPRRLQELRLAIGRVTDQLAQETGRSPTVADLAERLGIPEEEVLEGLESRQAYATSSLDAGTSTNGEESGGGLAAILGDYDKSLAHVDNWSSVRPLIEALPEREQRILMMRFAQDKTQSEIATELGISQMHVSRLLARTLAKLRTDLGDEY